MAKPIKRRGKKSARLLKNVVTQRLTRKIRYWGTMGYRAQQERLYGNYKGAENIAKDRSKFGELILQEMLEKIVNYERSSRYD